MSPTEAQAEAVRRIRQARAEGAWLLDLGDLPLDELPEGLGTLSDLRALALGRRAARSGGDGVEWEYQTDRRAQRFSELSPLSGLTNLRLLDLSWCVSVTDFGPLSGLAELEHLDLSWCKGPTSVAPLSGLTELRYLSLCGCVGLTDVLPLTGLTALRTLDLSWCAGLTGVGPLSGLTALQSLSLYRCKGLRDISTLSGLTALRSLDLSGCLCLTDLSPLSGLDAMRSLNLSGCESLTSLSPLIDAHGDLRSNLEDLRLFDCRLKDVPEEVCGISWGENVIDKVRAHLADLKRGRVEDAEWKLFVLGNGGVGKTQACRRLRQLPYDETIPTTHGVQLGEFRLNLEGGAGPVQVRLWDFGGQDVYHGTHALFLQSHAVFVVFWSPDHEEGELEEGGLSLRKRPLAYWLDYIRALAGTRSPVLVVQGQCDEPPQRRTPPHAPVGDFAYLRFLEFSARTDLGLDSLKAHIKEGIRNLLAARPLSQIGAGRAEVRRKLREMPDRTLTQEQFRALCDETGKVSSADALLDFLHRSGVVFYRPGLFEERIILDQTWALQAIYTLLDRKRTLPLLARYGRFTRQDLADLVWQKHSVEEQETLLGMMRSCGICFPARAHPQPEYIAPDLLPEWSGVQDQLFGRLCETPAASGATVSFTVLHDGILRALLSRIGERAGDAAVYWKYGCWFGEQTSDSVLLIRSRWGDSGSLTGSITLEAWGEEPDKLIDAVLRTLTDIPVGQPPEVTRTSDRSGLPTPDVIVAAGGVESLKVSPRSPLPEGSPKQVFVSYAWGDDSPQGKERGAVVERLCHQLHAWDYKVFRDKDHMRPGDLISDFMKLLSGGSRVIVILSEKYLRSVYCMTELHEVFVQSRNDKADFLRRIVPLTLADARIDTIRERNDHVRHWRNEVEGLRQDVAEGLLGPGDYRDWHKMTRWVTDVSEMLKHIVDVLHPHGFEQIVQDDFAALRALLERDC
jgi:internalin A